MNSLFKTVTTGSSQRNEDPNVLPFQQAGTSQQQIFIRDLRLKMSIGVLESEKKKKQTVVVNATLVVDPDSDWKEDDIKNVVSYADIIELIQIVSQTKHFNLLETFAEEIIEKCFEDKRVLGVQISAEKPEIIKDTNSVGITISRDRHS